MNLHKHVSKKLSQGGEHTFIQKTLKNPHLSIYNRKYYLHFARLNHYIDRKIYFAFFDGKTVA